jgi:hypothetical protein
MKIPTNWRTDLAGVLLLVSVVAHWLATGIAPTSHDIDVIFAAFGLIAAKDAVSAS